MAAGVAQWRAWDNPRTRLGLLLGLLGIAAIGLIASQADGIIAAALFGLVVAGLVSLLRALLARVRLTDAGVEVRLLATRTYAWAEIGAVQLTAPGAPPGIVLLLRGDTRQPDPVRLPVPQGRRDDPALRDAVAAIRARIRA